MTDCNDKKKYAANIGHSTVTVHLQTDLLLLNTFY